MTDTKPLNQQTMNFCRQLADFDPNIRRHAMKKLQEYADPVSIPYLIQSLSDTDTLVKTGAENTLVKIGEEAISQVVEVFSHEMAETRLRAIYVYDKVNTSTYLEKLAPLILDADQDVQKMANKCLSKQLTGDASKALWTIFKENDKEEIRGVARELLLANVVDIDELLLSEIKTGALDLESTKLAGLLYLQLKPGGNEHFKDKITDDVPEIRMLSLATIAGSNPAEALEKAKAMAEDEDQEVRKKAVEFIGKFGTAEELEFLHELKNTPSLGVWKVSKLAIEQIESRI